MSALTPAQAAYERAQANMRRRFGGIAPIGWDELDAEAQADWAGVASDAAAAAGAPRPRTPVEALAEMDPAKLDMLADWLGLDDKRKARTGPPEVQADLRRWAQLAREEQLWQLSPDGPPPAVTAVALAAALDGREILVTGVRSAPGDSTWRAVPARPGELAVQLLTSIDRRLTDDPAELAELRELLAIAARALGDIASFTEDAHVRDLARAALEKTGVTDRSPADG